MEKQLSAPDQAKVASNYLRGTLPEELQNSEASFSKSAITVLKFHGIYQQDDRDLRKLGPKQYSAMIRVGVPGGVLTADQYLALDRLADFGDGSLRVTTRQDIQYHYVQKEKLPEALRGIHDAYLSTLAACGDVVRNVVSCPAPFESETRRELQPLVQLLSSHLKPKTSAYLDVWINGEKAITGEQEADESVEPLYGRTYLPRKFKIAFAYPGDNTTDVYANDIGIVPHYEAATLIGFTILAGGGMGQSAGVKTSHPRLADPICFVGPDTEFLLKVVSAIVTIHRDFGNRVNRKMARLKYVMDEWGVPKFKAELEDRIGCPLEPPKTLSWTRADDYLGWHKQAEGAWFLGVRVVAGRIRDFESGARVRSGLRKVVERFRPSVRLTAQQNLYLADIRDGDKDAVMQILHEHGIREAHELPPLLRHAMSCPALPTCGQAITESERIMPGVVAEVQELLNDANLPDEIVHLRTTGCPNGCARPYTAEIGIVGASVDMYTVYLGASKLGTRLGIPFAKNVKRHAVPELLRPVIQYFSRQRHADEGFGDFCDRIGIDALKELAQADAAA